jgi:hypothetical protein
MALRRAGALASARAPDRSSPLNPEAMMANLMTSSKLLLLPAAAVAVLCATAMLAPRPAAATPAYASQTKLPCGQCHTTPAGGPLKPFGEKFKADGYKVK